MQSRERFNGLRGLFVSVGSVATVLGAVSLGLAQTPFYQGKVITVIQGREPGGAGDLRARATTNFLQKYLSGATIVHQFMAGGGGLRVANHIFAGAPADGLTIGSVSSGMLGSAVLGGSGVKYQIEKFHFLGAADAGGQYVFYTKKDAGFSNIDKLRAASGLRIGAQSVGHNNYNIGRLAAYLLDLREARFVTGYSSPEIDAALLRGEVDARFNEADSVIQRNADWVEKNIMDFHFVLEIPKGAKHPRFSHLPEIETFAKTERERQLVALQRGFRIIGSPFILPPATPPDRVALLQAAMAKAFRDPSFPAEFKKLVGDDPGIVMPDVMDKTIKELPRAPEVVEILKQLAGPNPLPRR
jgi:tripartite-type tricarboxylate transporter receptor subunit TctC